MLGEQVHVVVQGEDERGLRPEGHVRHAELPGQRRRPHEEGVGDEARGGRVDDDAAQQLLDVRGEHVQHALHELIVVQRPVEAQGEAVAHQLIPQVHPRRRRGRPAHAGEDVAVVPAAVAEGARRLVVHGLRVDEGDGEAPRCKSQREVHRRDDVALQWVRDHHGVRLGVAAGGAVRRHGLLPHLSRTR